MATKTEEMPQDAGWRELHSPNRNPNIAIVAPSQAAIAPPGGPEVLREQEEAQAEEPSPQEEKPRARSRRRHKA